MLDALNSNRDDWPMRARVCRIWESANPNMGVEYSLDMILMDENVITLIFSDICLLIILL